VDGEWVGLDIRLDEDEMAVVASVGLAGVVGCCTAAHSSWSSGRVERHLSRLTYQNKKVPRIPHLRKYLSLHAARSSLLTTYIQATFMELITPPLYCVVAGCRCSLCIAKQSILLCTGTL
jgi:hypothetical protein